MIPETNAREVHSKGVRATGAFSLSLENTDHIMTILRDTLYSNKILAVLREYSSNAWDAHREAGIPTTPISVTLPTEDNLVLSIRDYGLGLSPDDVLNVFTQYGASTKRTSNQTVGMLGIGSKSAFCYTDNFTIISRHAGWASTYVAFLDSSNRGEINQIDDSPCGAETGLEIQIAVKEQDIGRFKETARILFEFFNPYPACEELPAPATPVSVEYKSALGYVREPSDVYSSAWRAVMGCISYKIDINQIISNVRDYRNVISHMNGVVYFNIGDLQISASREELRYDDNTKKKCAEVLDALVDEYVTDKLNVLLDPNITSWEKRILARTLVRSFGVALPEGLAIYAKSQAILHKETEAPATFVLRDVKRTAQNTLDLDSPIYFRSDFKTSIKNYNLAKHSLIIDPRRNCSREAVMAEFEALCRQARFDGAPVKELSTATLTQQAAKQFNKKHIAACFELDPAANIQTKHALSSAWKICDREPQDTDVYVILNAFKVSGVDDFYKMVRNDRYVLSKYGITLPPIYSYKTTQINPVTRAQCKGVTYAHWRNATMKNKFRNDEIAYLHFLSEMYNQNWRPISALRTYLPKAHPIIQALLAAQEAEKKVRAFTKDSEHLRLILTYSKPARANNVLSKYPLLTWDDLRRAKYEVFEYIQLIDERVITRVDRLLPAGR